mmetsp:Transcript_27765/g.41309  ORF Transcript_27765/g.41309 Transcript_27765/m.41309 type:complete len:382 (-) Transcript_27765:328-1473(-)
MKFLPLTFGIVVAVVPSSAFLSPSLPSSRSRIDVGVPSTKINRNNAIMVRMAQKEDTYVESTTDNARSNQKKDTTASLALLTFDLDDTLFPVGPVVRDANEAMTRRMKCLGYESATSQGVIDATRTIRVELSKASPGTALTYSELRIRAIRKEIERCLLSSGRTTDQLDDSVVIDVFDAWLNERHAAAERHLFSDALNMFECLRKDFPDACIGAITNGRGDPLEMKSTLSSFFDFTVSGEDEGVFPNRKPHPGIYKAAIERFESIGSIRQSVFSNTDILEVMRWDGVEKGNGATNLCWVHVGDDLANDVGASAACGAQAVWLDPDEDEDDSTPFWSTATNEEIERRKRMNDLARDSVSAKISTLLELPDAIRQILDTDLEK